MGIAPVPVLMQDTHTRKALMLVLVLSISSGPSVSSPSADDIIVSVRSSRLMLSLCIALSLQSGNVLNVPLLCGCGRINVGPCMALASVLYGCWGCGLSVGLIVDCKILLFMANCCGVSGKMNCCWCWCCDIAVCTRMG